MKKNDKYYKEKFVRVKTSKKMWTKFDSWWRNQGCTTRAGGIRLAMRLVIHEK